LFLDSIQSPLAGKQRKRGRFLLLLGLCAELSKQQESFFFIFITPPPSNLLLLLLLLLSIAAAATAVFRQQASLS